jgi:hypothetical protein
VRLVSRELDTSWFDLKIYEDLKKMSLEEWVKVLGDRHIYYSMVEIYVKHHVPNNIVDENLLTFLASVVTFLQTGDTCLVDTKKFPKVYRRSVNDLTLFEIWLLSKDERMIHIQPDRCKDVLSKVALEPVGIDSDDRMARITVNLSAADEQIKRDFNHWLAHCRQENDIKSQKKLFTQTDFDYWIEYGVIPYMDLMLIARIENKRITQNKLARLIFPNEYDIDIVERLRKVTKPVAEELINNEIHKALSAQLSSEKATGMKTA